MNSNALNSKESLKTVSETLTDIPNAETSTLPTLLEDLQELLNIFKYDLSDEETDGVRKFISSSTHPQNTLSSEHIEILRSSMVYAVDTQETHVITDFLKAFSSNDQSSAFNSLGAWLKSKLILN